MILSSVNILIKIFKNERKMLKYVLCNLFHWNTANVLYAIFVIKKLVCRH